MGKGAADAGEKGRIEKVQAEQEREREIFALFLFGGASSVWGRVRPWPSIAKVRNQILGLVVTLGTVSQPGAGQSQTGPRQF
jgi:hypothetical protein